MQTISLLDDIIAGKRMDDSEFIWLYNQDDFISIGKAADIVRQQRFPGNTVSFIIDRNINYTNICSCGCKFCAFYRKKEDLDAYVIDKQVLFAKIEEAIELGASQLMIQGGLNEDLKIDFFEDMFRNIKLRFDIVIHSLTAPEIVYIAKISGLTIKETLTRLKHAGLDSLPGGGAEVLHDEVRSQISPNKIKAVEWLEVMRTAHQIGMKTTATMMMGSIDKLEHRVYHLHQIRELQDDTAGFRAFIPWTYEPGNNELMGNKMSSLEYLKFLALSRLYLDNFDHVQCSWLTQGKQIGQLSLYFGGDDLGSIMIEENVVRSAGLVYKMSQDEMISVIRGAGRKPVRRDTEYRYLEYF